jgi:WD40 repeat protein
MQGYPESVAVPPPYIPPRGTQYYRWVAEVGREAADALAYAHSRGVIHRDVKPSNLLADAQGSIWVADFGLARRLTDPGVTHSESLLGTPRYMSPEQTRCLPLDGRTDTYSLGATLYELLTLRPPFDGRSTAELVEQIGRDEPISPRRLDTRIPRDLETIILKALSKAPSDRYSDAAALAADLDRFLHFEPVQARRISPFGRALRLMRRHPALSGVILGAMAVILAVATIAYVRVVQERDRAILAERGTQAALREGLLSQASLLRTSTVPDRRERGLGLLSQAARMRPGADLRSRLQTEAIAFLALRDVERGATIATGHSPGLAFGPDGNRLVLVTEDRNSFVSWSIETAQPVDRPGETGPPRARGPIRDRFGDGGRPPGPPPMGAGPRIAACGPLLAVLWPDGHGIRLIDASTGSRTSDIECPDRDLTALFATASPAGPRLVTIDRGRPEAPERPRGPGDGFRQISLWDPAQPEAPPAVLVDSRLLVESRSSEPPLGFPLVATAHDLDTVAIGWMRSDRVALYSARDGQSLGEIDVGTSVSALALDRFGHLAAAGGGTVRLWDVRDHTPLPGVTPHQGFIRSLRFSPDGALLAVSGNGTDVEIWDPAANTLVAALPTTEPVMELAFSPSGRHLAAGQVSGVALWAIVEPAVLAEASGFESLPSGLAFDPEGRLVMAFRGGESARLWQPAQCLTSAVPAPGTTPSAVAFTADGHLAALDDDTLLLYRDAAARDPDESLNLPAPHPPEEGGRGRPFWPPPLVRQFQTIAPTPDGRTLALIRYGQVLLWHASSPDRVGNLILPPEPTPPRDRDRDRGPRRWQPPWTQVALAPRGDRLYLAAAGLGGGELQVWSLAGDRATRVSWPADLTRITALALSPDGATLALGDRSGGITLVETARGTIKSRLKQIDASDGVITALAFAPTGRPLLVAGTKQGTVLLYPLDGPEPSLPLRLTGHRGGVLNLAFGVTGRRLASSGEDKVVNVWNLDRLGQELTQLGLAW